MKTRYILISVSTLMVGLGVLPFFVSAAGTLAEEEAEGRAIVEQVQSKTLQYSALTDEQFELVGEYAMGLMMGAGHEAMNQSLVARFGETGERAMHIQMGKQFLGTGYDASGLSTYGGYGMMGNWGGYGGMMGGFGSMMGSYGPAYGYGYSSTASGFMFWVFALYHVLIVVLLVLGVVWLARKISSKK